jgi:hypothetical protein
MNKIKVKAKVLKKCQSYYFIYFNMLNTLAQINLYGKELWIITFNV